MVEQNVEMKYAGFWLRVVAAIIDGVIINIALAPILFVFGKSSMESMMAAGADQPVLPGSFVGIQLICMLIPWLYSALTESSAWQTTVGKKLLGLKVTGIDGGKIGFWRATARHWSKIISAIILCIGFLMVAFTKRKQGLHDMIGGTLVVKRS